MSITSSKILIRDTDSISGENNRYARNPSYYSAT